MEVYESLFGGEPKPEVKKTILSVVKNQETQGLFLSVPGSSSSDLPSQPLGLGIVDMLSTKLLVKDSALLKPAAIIESPGLVGTVIPPATLFKPPGLVSTTPPLKKTPLPAFRASSDIPTASPLLMSTKPPNPLSLHILFGGAVLKSPQREKRPEGNFPTGGELFPHTPLVTLTKIQPMKQVITPITDLCTGVPSPETDSPDFVERDPTHCTRSPKTDAQGEYVLVINWAPNWATRKGWLDGEAIYTRSISQINLHSSSSVVGQIGNMIRVVEFSMNAQFGNDITTRSFMFV